MFLKNSLSSDGVGVAAGGGVCARTPTAITSTSIMPKRHCDLRFLRMLISFVLRLLAHHEHGKRSGFHRALRPAAGCCWRRLSVLGRAQKDLLSLRIESHG